MQTQTKENINRILVKTPHEKIMLHSLKKEVVNQDFTISIKDFKSLKQSKIINYGQVH